MSDLPGYPNIYLNEDAARFPFTARALCNTVFQALGTASVCWKETPSGVFDSDRCAQVGTELVHEIIDLTSFGKPSLGCATTRELLEELSARFDVGFAGLDYRTVNHD